MKINKETSQNFSTENNKIFNSKSQNNINYDNKTFNNNKTSNALNEFKKLLKETEKTTSLLNFQYKNNQNLMNKEDNEKYLNGNSKINDSNILYNDTTENGSEDLFEDNELNRLKISNDVLIKANIDLKNKNKILTNEINTYKNSSVYKNPYSQFDNNLNEFIQDLKTSLENAQMSNKELIETINNIQEDKKKLTNSNVQVLNNYENIKNEYEKIIKENSELKTSNEIKDNKIENLTINIENLKKNISQMDSMLLTNEKQINYLNTINNSNLITQKDSDEIILKLKETIQNLQNNNSNTNDENKNLNDKINQLNDNINNHLNDIENFKNKINENNKEI